MRLLVPTEFTLSKDKKVWGLISCEVSPEGDVFDLQIKPTGATAWMPFCTAALVDVPNVGTTLAFRMYGQATQEGEVTPDGIRTPKAS